ncbi:hypothetical protein D9M68_451290 [compost metagenome]
MATATAVCFLRTLFPWLHGQSGRTTDVASRTRTDAGRLQTPRESFLKATCTKFKSLEYYATAMPPCNER